MLYLDASHTSHTRAHTGISRVLFGSVSHYCLTHAQCVVVAVPTTSVDHLLPLLTRKPPEIGPRGCRPTCWFR